MKPAPPPPDWLTAQAKAAGTARPKVKVSTKRGPVACLVEIKTSDGKLSPSQLRFIGEWGSCVTVVQTREDVFDHVQRVREQQ